MTTPPSLSALVECKRLIDAMDAERAAVRAMRDYTTDESIAACAKVRDAERDAGRACIAYVRSLPTAPESAPDVSLGELWEWFAAERKYRNEVAAYNTALALNRAEIESGELAWPGRNLDPLYQAWNASQKESREAMRRLFDALESNESALRAQSPAEGGCNGLDTPERVRFYERDFYPLSNFSAFRLKWQGISFDTSEAAYHYTKFVGYDQGVCWDVQDAPSAHEAFKVAERNKHLRRPDWDNVKLDVMRAILRAKVDQHEYVRRKLLATGDRLLVEDSWRDDYWGWGPNRDGQNWLGKLWMEVRSELRATPTAIALRESQAEGKGGEA